MMRSRKEWIQRIVVGTGVGLLAVACGGANEVSPEQSEAHLRAARDLSDVPDQGRVTSRDPDTRPPPALRGGMLRDSFSNGVKIDTSEVQKMGATYYLVRTGHNGDQCQTTASPLAEENGALTLARDNGGGYGATASCSGDPCSACRFVETNGVVTGCKCADAAGKCNHTITTTTLQGIFIY